MGGPIAPSGGDALEYVITLEFVFIAEALTRYGIGYFAKIVVFLAF